METSQRVADTPMGEAESRIVLPLVDMNAFFPLFMGGSLEGPLNKSILSINLTSGAKARIDSAALAARLKSCPFTKQN
jgi:hypothetical protein